MTEQISIHSLLDKHVHERPGAPALKDQAIGVITWSKYRDCVTEACAMLHELSVDAGDRVAIVCENCIAVPVLTLACSRLGAIAVPLNARMSGEEIAKVIGHAAPKALFFSSQVSTEAAKHAKDYGAKTNTTGFGTVSVATGNVSVPADAGEDHSDVAVMLYTTGTTGDPKGVLLTHENLLFTARSSTHTRQLNAADHIYCALPLTHVFGLASVILAAANAGCLVELAARFSPEDVLGALDSGATMLPGVPQMHAMLMAFAAGQGRTTLGSDRLRHVLSGAAPLDPAWKRKAEAFFGLPLQNGYGMTETTAGTCTTMNPLGDPDTSVGPPIPGVEVRIDESVGSGDGVGEVQVRGPNIMKGYYRNPQATEETILPDGYLKTGDMGRIDEQGRVHIVGRLKELIIRGGFNVYPPEVEAALTDHPAVVQAAVIGHRLHGDERVLAFCQPTNPAAVSERELREFVSQKLTGYKRPNRIFLVSSLPSAPSGKVLKHKLIDEFSDLVAQE